MSSDINDTSELSFEEKKALANKKRLTTRLNTRKRHEELICKTYELKFDFSRLSKLTITQFKRLFLEAKWLKNAIIASGEPATFDTKVKQVQVKVKDTFETRDLKQISAQMKQAVKEQVKSDLKGLKEKKDKGYKVGRLKFKSWVGSIPLKQFGNTYKLTENNRIQIQKIKQNLRVRGLKQIPEGAEWANAKLIQRAGDYFLHVTCFISPLQLQKHKAKIRKPGQKRLPLIPKYEDLGLDFGVAHQVTLSNGIQIQYGIPICKELRKLHKSLSRKEKGSSNRRKAQVKLQRGYAKTKQIKENIKAQLVALLSHVSKHICVQDDYIKGWQRIWGKRIMETSIGGILGKLKELPDTTVVDRFFPSSQLCPVCNSKTKHELCERMFVCGECGYQTDRDLNAARNIRDKGVFERIGAVHTESSERRETLAPKSTPVDTKTSTLILDFLSRVHHVRASLVVEAGSLSSHKGQRGSPSAFSLG